MVRVNVKNRKFEETLYFEDNNTFFQVLTKLRTVYGSYCKKKHPEKVHTKHDLKREYTFYMTGARDGKIQPIKRTWVDITIERDKPMDNQLIIPFE